MWVRVHLHVCMCTCVPGALRGQKRVWDSLELEKGLFVSSCVGAGNLTLVLTHSHSLASKLFL